MRAAGTLHPTRLHTAGRASDFTEFAPWWFVRSSCSASRRCMRGARNNAARFMRYAFAVPVRRLHSACPAHSRCTGAPAFCMHENRTLHAQRPFCMRRACTVHALAGRYPVRFRWPPVRRSLGAPGRAAATAARTVPAGISESGPPAGPQNAPQTRSPARHGARTPFGGYPSVRRRRRRPDASGRGFSPPRVSGGGDRARTVPAELLSALVCAVVSGAHLARPPGEDPTTPLSVSCQPAPVLTAVKAHRYALFPLRGADGLDGGSAQARANSWPTGAQHAGLHFRLASSARLAARASRGSRRRFNLGTLCARIPYGTGHYTRR